MAGDAENAGAEELFKQLSADFLAKPGVTAGTGFGKVPGLRINGKIFAMASRGRLVLKLPRSRVDKMLCEGTAEPFAPRQDGRAMKEWVSVPVTSAGDWRGLISEALEFVAAAASGRRS